MGKINVLKILVSMVVSTQLILSGSPAMAISVELAKKCRDLAIKAHPPKPAGTNPYAQAERDYFNDCVSKNGDVTATQKPPADNR
jgi:hypothetical protein